MAASSEPQARKERRKLQTQCFTCLEPTMLPNQIEISVHTLPKMMKRELRLVLPGLNLDNILAIPTSQHAKMDLVNIGPDVAQEKDDLLEKFVEWSASVCSSLEKQGHWADYIDPCSGLPVETQGRTRGNTVYPEVDGFEVLRQYRCTTAGPCKVLVHPVWGTAVYPATMFTSAPVSAVADAINAASGTDTVTLRPPPVDAGGGSSGAGRSAAPADPGPGEAPQASGAGDSVSGEHETAASSDSPAAAASPGAVEVPTATGSVAGSKSAAEVDDKTLT